MAQGSASVSAGRVVLGGGLLFLLGFLVLTGVVTRQGFDGVDLLARSLVHQSHHPGLQSFMEGASFLGGQPGQVAVVVIGSVMLWPRRRRWALALPLVMAGVGVVQLSAKWAVDRPRPNLDPWGFPSAHVLSLVVLCGFLAYMVCMASTRRRWQHAGVGACAGIVGIVAYSRMYLDAHWLSDVLGGLTAGLAYLLVAIWLIHAAPRLGRVLRPARRESPADGLLVPAPAGPSPDSLIAAAAVVAMTSATPTADAS
jgi:membrane-associated phospholipid phosphatase